MVDPLPQTEVLIERSWTHCVKIEVEFVRTVRTNMNDIKICSPVDILWGEDYPWGVFW